MQKETRIRAWIGALCVAILIVPQPVATKESNPDIITSLETMIETIKVAPSPLARAKTAEQLWIFVQHQEISDLDALDDKVIDDIASLLKDLVVRHWIAQPYGGRAGAGFRQHRSPRATSTPTIWVRSRSTSTRAAKSRSAPATTPGTGGLAYSALPSARPNGAHSPIPRVRVYDANRTYLPFCLE